ncbi:MAG: hypothetical protein ACP5N7_04625 [Candidatus Pacearchaeota archaeon]
MKLPDLPKLRKHKETDITPSVMAWFMDNYPNDYAVEVKIKEGRLKKHQPVALKKVHEGKFDMKLKDWGALNPFDFFGLKKADAFIVRCDGRLCTAYTYDNCKVFDFKV